MRERFTCKCILVHLCRMTWIFFLLFGTISNLKANTINEQTISGTVISAADKEPMIGVSVLIKGTTSGTITDYDGKFSLNASPGETLIFSYIRYQSKDIRVSNQTVSNISMEEDSQSHDAIVVLGDVVEKHKILIETTVQI